MQNRSLDRDLSGLEQEFELELGDLLDQSGGFKANLEQDEEHESDEFEYELESEDIEQELESDDFESDDMEHELEMLFESDDSEYEMEDSGGLTPYAERLYELSQGSFESEAEVDEKLNSLLTQMEYEYFWNPLKSIKKAVKGIAKSPFGGPLASLAKKGFQMVGKNVPVFQALQGITKLARGDMRGLMGSLMKAGLGAAIPGAGQFLPTILSSLGFSADGSPAKNREAWNNIDAVAREAYNYLAENLNEEIDNPLEASRLTNAAFQTAVRQVQNNPQNAAQPNGNRSGSVRDHRRKKTQVVILRPGQNLLIRVRRQ